MRRTIGLVVAMVSVGCFACAAHAQVNCWEFDISPTVTTEYQPAMTEYNGNTGDPNPNRNGYGSGLGLLGNGMAEFADSSTAGLSGDYGFVYNFAGTGSFTLDVRVKVIENVNEGGGKSMTIKNDINQRGVKLRTDRVELVSSGVTGGPWAAIDMATDFQIIRLSVNSTISASNPNIVTVYAWNAGTSTWTTLGSTNLGGSGGGAEVAQPGIGIGSLAGSSTQSGKFIIDWARLHATQALGDTGAPLAACNPVSCSSGVIPVATANATGYTGGGTAVMTNMGSPDYVQGLHVLPNTAGFDGNTEVVVVGGRSGRQAQVLPSDGYIFFAADDAFMYQGNHPDVYITAYYYDADSGALALQYDAGPGHEYDDGGSINMGGTHVWLSHTWHVTNAWFGNSQAWGSDFRFGNGQQKVPIDSVVVAYGPGPDTTYTITNLGDASMDWTVAEVNVDGTAHDYPWLSLTSMGSTLGAGLSATTKALMDTTGQSTPSLLKGYLKFIDGCPLPAAYAEPFTPYSAGTLVGQGGWTGGTDTSPFMVEINGGNNELNLNGGGDSSTALTAAHFATGMVDKEGVFSVTIKVKTGGSLPDRTGNNFWAFRALDGAGTNFGYVQGSPTTFVARNPINAGDASAVQTITSSYQTIEMRINTGAKTTAYYVNGGSTPVFTTPFNASGGVASIAFERINGASTSGSEYVYVDDVGVALTQQYKLREIDLNVVGCSLTAVPRVAAPVTGCGGTVTRTFSVINNGASAITGFTVQQADPLSGNPYPAPVPWLILPDTTGVTIPSGSSADVTVGIDLAQVTGTEKATLQISSTCSSGTARDTLVDALTVTKAVVTPANQLLIYPGNAIPTHVGFSTFDTTASEADWSVVTDPDAVDKAALRVNDTHSNKTKFYYSATAPNIVPTTGATLFARLKTVAFDGTAKYGNLWIYGPSISAEVFWGGPTGELRCAGASVFLPGDTAYHTIRVTSRDMGAPFGICMNVYFDEDPIPKLALTNVAPYNSPIPGGVSGFGFGVAAGTADAQDIYFDCFTATDAGAFAPGEEVACLGKSLTCPNLCHTPFADVDGDGDVDQEDFGVFQECFTGTGHTPVPSEPVYCQCLDQGDDHNLHQPEADHDIDSFDLAAFEKCATGPGIPWTATTDCP